MSLKDILKFLLLFLFLIFLCSCATNIKRIQADEDRILSQEEGYLLIGIDTQVDLHRIRIDGPQNIFLTKNDLKSGGHYILVNLPAGEYSIDQIFSYRNIKFRFDKDNWRFSVKPQMISYVGDLEVSITDFGFGGYFELINNSASALVYLEENYPNILDKRKIVYTGVLEDRFFDYVRSYKEGSNGGSL